MNDQKWIKEYFKETWKKSENDIDFSKYEPISTSSSLHIYEERFLIDGRTYRLLYAIDSKEPLVEILV